MIQINGEKQRRPLRFCLWDREGHLPGTGQHSVPLKLNGQCRSIINKATIFSHHYTSAIFSGPSMPFRTTELPIFMNFAGHQKKPRHFAGRILHLDADAWGLWSCCRYLGATAERYPKRRNRWGSTESFCSDASTSSSETSMTFIDLGISALKWTSTQKLKMEPELSGVFGCTFFAPIGKVLTISRSKWLNTIWVGVVL